MSATPKNQQHKDLRRIDAGVFFVGGGASLFVVSLGKSIFLPPKAVPAVTAPPCGLIGVEFCPRLWHTRGRLAKVFA